MSNAQQGDQTIKKPANNMHMKYLQAQQPDLQLQYLTLQAFWSKVREEMSAVTDEVDPMKQQIPVDYVEGEFKLECQGSPELSAMGINRDASIALAKATELFILEMTLRAWQGISSGNRHNLKADDIRKAIQIIDSYDLFINLGEQSDRPIINTRNN